MFNKNSSRTLSFDLTDTNGAYLTGKTVVSTISKDSSPFTSVQGVVTEIGNGVYAFAGTNTDFNCDTFALRFTATGARDVFIHGITESDYTSAKAAFLDSTISSRAVAGNVMSLAPAERETLATIIESHLLNEGDGQMLVNAIVNAIGNTNLDQSAFIAAIRSDIERTGGTLKGISNDYARRTGDLSIPTAGQIVTAIKNDTEWKTILAGVNGAFTFDAINNVLILKDASNTMTLATLTITKNNDGLPISRTSS